MIEHAPEKVIPAIGTEELSSKLFDADVHVLFGEQAVADAEGEIIRRITGHSLTTKEYDDIHQSAYFERRDAEIELKRVLRREARAKWLGRLSFWK